MSSRLQVIRLEDPQGLEAEAPCTLCGGKLNSRECQLEVGPEEHRLRFVFPGLSCQDCGHEFASETIDEQISSIGEKCLVEAGVMRGVIDGA